MSYLYKALLKEQNQQPSAIGEPASASAMNTNQPYQQHLQPMESNPSPSWITWLVIAILLLVIGLLGGFILGNQNQTQNQSSQAPQQVQTTLSTPSEVNAVIQNQGELSKATNDAEANQSNSEQAAQTDTSTKQTNHSDESVVANTAEIKTAADNSESGSTQNDIAQTAIDDEEQLVIKLDEITKTDATLDDVPEELQNKFAQVLEELNAEDIERNSDSTENTYDNNQMERSSYIETSSTLPDINELEAVDRALLPAMTYEMHIYSSEARERWVRINNQTLYEGDKLNQNLKLVEIRQDSIIWETTYKRFSHEALSDYK